MTEASGIERSPYFEDRRMWRLLLARLHPDAGGDHELFTFACAVKEELLGAERTVKHPEAGEGGSQPRPDLFLRTWQEAMGRWSSSNFDALRDFGAR